MKNDSRAAGMVLLSDDQDEKSLRFLLEFGRRKNLLSAEDADRIEGDVNKTFSQPVG